MFIVTPTTKLGTEEHFAVFDHKIILILFDHKIFHVNKKFMYFKSACSPACWYAKSILSTQRSFLLTPQQTMILIKETIALWTALRVWKGTPFSSTSQMLHHILYAENNTGFF